MSKQSPSIRQFPNNPYDPPGWQDMSEWARNTAPEHQRDASSMEKDYPRDEWGRRILNSKKELVIDPRPAIMLPARKTYSDQIKLNEF